MFSLIVQVYAPTSSYDDSKFDEFYRERQSLVDQTLKQDILVAQVLGTRRLEKMHKRFRKKSVDLSALWRQ